MWPPLTLAGSRFIAGLPMKPRQRCWRGCHKGPAACRSVPPVPVQHDDPVRHGHRLDLVMGDIQDRGLQPLVKGLDLGPHLDAQLCVKVRQGFVEQKDLGVAHDGAAHRDTLALAA